MTLTNNTFLNSFLCNYNWHGKDQNSTAKKQAKPLHTNFILPADSTCQIDCSATLLLQPLDVVTEL